MNIINLTKLTKWENVARAHVFHYPNDKNNYKKLFFNFQKMSPQKTKKGESLNIFVCSPLGEDPKDEWQQKYIEDLKKRDESQYYGISLKKKGNMLNYALSFIRWRYLASMPINSDTLNHYTIPDILAHFLWEITFYGMEKEMLKHGKELMRRVKEVKSGKAKLIPCKSTTT